MSIDAVLGKSGCQTGCFYALLNWFRSPTGASTMIEDYLLSCILSLYGRMSQRASLSIPHLQVIYPGPPHLPSYLLSLYLIKRSDAAIGAAADCHFPPPYFSLCVPSLLYEGAAFYQLHLNRPRPRARPLVRQEFASPACTLSSSPFRYYVLLGVRILLSPVLILRYCRVYLLPPCFGTVQYYRVCLS